MGFEPISTLLYLLSYVESRQISRRVPAVNGYILIMVTGYMLNSSVTTLDSKITMNKCGTKVDISSYKQGTFYTFSSDGFIEMRNTSNQSATIYVQGPNNLTFYVLGGVQGYFGGYVRKGMKATLYGGAVDYCNFCPLIS